MELKNCVYYVLDKDEYLDTSFVFAKYSPEYDTFYDIKDDDVYDDEELYSLEVGQRVLRQHGGWDLFDKTIDEGIVNKANEYKIRRKALEEKYPDLGPNVEENIPDTKDLFYNHFDKKIKEGQEVDPYILGIIDLLIKPMDIRVRRRHNGYFYDQLGLDYPEDVFDTLDALYSVVSEKVANLDSSSSLSLCFYGVVRNSQPTRDFYDEVEKRTGFRFGSQLSHKLESIEYHSSAGSSRYQELSKQRPVVWISKDSTIYYSDYSSFVNGTVEEITPETCKEKYSNMFGSSDAKIFQKTKNDQN